MAVNDGNTKNVALKQTLQGILDEQNVIIVDIESSLAEIDVKLNGVSLPCESGQNKARAGGIFNMLLEHSEHLYEIRKQLSRIADCL